MTKRVSVSNKPHGDPFGRKAFYTGQPLPTPPIPRNPVPEAPDPEVAAYRYIVQTLERTISAVLERNSYWQQQMLASNSTLNRTLLEVVEQNNLLLAAYIKDVRIAELKAVHWEAHAQQAFALLEAIGKAQPKPDDA